MLHKEHTHRLTRSHQPSVFHIRKHKTTWATQHGPVNPLTLLFLKLVQPRTCAPSGSSRIHSERPVGEGRGCGGHMLMTSQPSLPACLWQSHGASPGLTLALHLEGGEWAGGRRAGRKSYSGNMDFRLGFSCWPTPLSVRSQRVIYILCTFCCVPNYSICCKINVSIS